MCHESDKPIYITKNGYSDAVIMSNETFENQIGRVEDYYKGLLSAMKSNAVMKELEKLSPREYYRYRQTGVYPLKPGISKNRHLRGAAPDPEV